MEIHSRPIDGAIQALNLDGEMDLYNANELKSEVDHLLGRNPQGLVVDLERLNYIDSSGISALLYTFTQCRKRGVGLCFVHVRGSVKKVIELTSLTGFFPIADSISDAVARLKANRQP